MLFARESDARTVDSVSSDEVENLRILLASRAESPPSGWNIVEEVLYLVCSASRRKLRFYFVSLP